MVSAWGCEQRLVLGQIATDAKSNEITAGNWGKTPGSGPYAGWPRQRTRSGRGGTSCCPEIPSLLPR
jgi:hypothetical protein